MNNLRLRNNNPTEENVLKIINHIKDIETERGLTKDEIEYKYTQGHCSSLVEMVQHFLPSVRPIWFWNYEECSHYCLAIENPDKNSGKYLDLDYFDINGKKSYKQITDWMYEYFGLNIKCFNVGEESPSRSNEIKEDVYNSIVIENEQVLQM